MKKTLAATALCGLLLGGCTAAQNAMFTADVATLTADINTVNAAIANLDAAIQPGCTQLVIVGQSLAAAVGTSKAAGAGIIGVSAALESYCTANPTNISQAVAAVAAANSAGKAAAASAKAGN
jgi:hypothetical protein